MFMFIFGFYQILSVFLSSSSISFVSYTSTVGLAQSYQHNDYLSYLTIKDTAQAVTQTYVVY